jgi:hypothetical protein
MPLLSVTTLLDNVKNEVMDNYDTVNEIDWEWRLLSMPFKETP